MHIAGTLMFFDEPGTLFLLDEPETHFNPEWRSRFINMLNKIAEKKQLLNKSASQFNDILLTTHSPFILSDSRKESIFIFSRDQAGKVGYTQPKINTYGASAHVLLQEIFGKSSTISEMTRVQIDALKNEEINTEEDIKLVKDKAALLGDSVEKFLLFVKLQKQDDSLKNH